MTDGPEAFAREYAVGMSEFLDRSDEESLQRAYELGRRAVAEGLGVLEVAAVHMQELKRRDSVPPGLVGGLREKAQAFFAEALAPYEMALSGFQEANRALKAWAATLEMRVAERTKEVEASQQALREKSLVLTRVMESISDGVVVADQNGRFVLVNAASDRFFGVGMTDALPEAWPSAFGVFRPDGATPFPPEELPLVRAVRGEQTPVVPMLLRNAATPEGMHLSVIGSPLRDENGVAMGGVAVFRDVTEAKRVEDALRTSEERFRLMFKANPVPMWTFDRESLAFVSVNDAAIRQYGYSREEFSKMTTADLRPPEDLPSLREELDTPNERPRLRHRRKDGSLIMVEITANDLELGGGSLRLVVANDVTERQKTQEALRKTEEQLRQSQKMDAIGRLAGGVAHDFNNILSVIISYGELLLADLKPNDPMRADIEEISKAGKRAADLTRQLLLFSRQHVLEPKVLDLNDTLASVDRMLQRILGADVELVSLRGQRLGRVRADPSAIEQVILNLVVNARDAMPTGGQLTIETANVELDEGYVREHAGARAGPHVMLAVTDTGVGMERATMARIFEPFFTTKEKGKGTGLGLSTVFGIVQQNGGLVFVYSEPGNGTTFKVYLPRVDNVVDTVAATAPPATLRGSETILLVDDDDQVRHVARSILIRNGYHVIEARNAGEALLSSERHNGTIHLLLTDVVMPQVSGPELARRLTAGRGEMKVLCMSGYTDDTVVRHGVIEAQVEYLQKPVTPESLTRKVREVLDKTLCR
jgi:two-component system, cell cycle sensor histidine kinase and response regulator CckA